MKSAAVLGAGSWGTALAKLLSEKGIDTSLWARNSDFAREIARERENKKYLPGFPLKDSLLVTSSIEEAICDRDVILFVVPSHAMRETAELVADTLQGRALPKALVSCAKGIENETLETMTDVLNEIFSSIGGVCVAVLSGPSFAKEVAQGMPTAVTIAAYSEEKAKGLQDFFSTDFLRVYTTQDVIGVQLGGAVKNVLAIAAGISDGLGFGTNTRAALITRGLAEMSRLGLKLGANPLTFAGLAGLGDLVLTCTGDLSRNRQVGLKLGAGKSMDEILDSMNMVAEGVKTSKSLYMLAQRHQVDMPIVEHVYKVIYEGMSPAEAVRGLLDRPQKYELYGVH
ncbi:MAG: NAD(P)-dependent glycerol-3-phosphate dehydrogenase [Thermodesulfobacteria bacterium]|nr:NAD(P)-dependent glycerol-3-phosphate dehydrogenase [Thermodesulfobacteriota bacterium]